MPYVDCNGIIRRTSMINFGSKDFIPKINVMQSTIPQTSFGSHFSQVAWVVNDIQQATKFFHDVVGINHFVKLENLSAKELEGTYYGKPADFVFHLYMGYSGDSLIELIEPVSGQSIFQDYLDKNGQAGIQHIAYTVPVDDLERSIAEFAGKGYPVITSLNLPVAHVVFFDTTKEIGVVTEVIGLTEAGVDFVAELKSAAMVLR
jgi:methylmalonyl-CoA/ethylmalonyl-CoA epimerase